jgi:hypothetical protein
MLSVWTPRRCTKSSSHIESVPFVEMISYTKGQPLCSVLEERRCAMLTSAMPARKGISSREKWSLCDRLHDWALGNEMRHRRTGCLIDMRQAYSGTRCQGVRTTRPDGPHNNNCGSPVRWRESIGSDRQSAPDKETETEAETNKQKEKMYPCDLRQLVVPWVIGDERVQIATHTPQFTGLSRRKEWKNQTTSSDGHMDQETVLFIHQTSASRERLTLQGGLCSETPLVS